ncbi:MAG: hypothetical protein JG781_953 [Peptococcaceae bacterium]|jgi:hypothetical protein|nr:hypothetical protein [Peptococcaceae bacterium]
MDNISITVLLDILIDVIGFYLTWIISVSVLIIEIIDPEIMVSIYKK